MVALKARAAPTHPRAQPEQREGLPWPQELASVRPKDEEFLLSTRRRHQKQHRRRPSVVLERVASERSERRKSERAPYHS